MCGHKKNLQWVLLFISQITFCLLLYISANGTLWPFCSPQNTNVPNVSQKHFHELHFWWPFTALKNMEDLMYFVLHLKLLSLYKCNHPWEYLMLQLRVWHALPPQVIQSLTKQRWCRTAQNALLQWVQVSWRYGWAVEGSWLWEWGHWLWDSSVPPRSAGPRGSLTSVCCLTQWQAAAPSHYNP